MADERVAGAATGAATGAASGAMIGSAVPVIGTAIGAVVGGLVGGAAGFFGSKKRKAPERASGAVYGYDLYGNLVNKGSYAYNPQTKQYELRAGELSGQERAMRNELAQNIASLMNTVSTTPDAFIRYAKELSDSYYRQGERNLAEQYDKAQTRLDESLARRGLSTSRAAGDLTAQLQEKRFKTLADIYDASQRYGYNVQSGLQSQATNAFNALRGYQNQLIGQDQNYLSQALSAQQIGQQYENAKAGVENQNIAQENQMWHGVLDTLNSLGTVAGYYAGSKPDIGTNTSGAMAIKETITPSYLDTYFKPATAFDTTSPIMGTQGGGVSTYYTDLLKLTR